jgi:photosystem II stability/assembly factor-like uncharacterized protein
MTLRTGIGVLLCCGFAVGCNNHVSPLASAPDASVPTGWTVIPAGTANLNAVSGISDSVVWVVGDHGTIKRWNGTELVSELSGTTQSLRGVWALDAQNAYAVGDAGTILQRTASGWQQVGAGITRQVLTAVWADSTRVVAVGSAATVILGTTASGYKILPPPSVNMNPVSANIFGVTGVPGGVVTMVGAIGLVMQLNGTSLSVVTPMQNGAPYLGLLSGATTGTGAAYFVGQQGTVFRADATGLNNILGCPGTALRGVSTAGANAWIVGWDGTICRLSGANATSFPYTDTRWFNGVYASSATSLWVVGASGTLLHGLPANPADGGAADGAVTDASTPEAG